MERNLSLHGTELVFQAPKKILSYWFIWNMQKMNKDSQSSSHPPHFRLPAFHPTDFFPTSQDLFIVPTARQRLQTAAASNVFDWWRIEERRGGRDQGTALSQSMERLSCYRNDENLPLRSKVSRSPDGWKAFPWSFFMECGSPCCKNSLKIPQCVGNILHILTINLSLVQFCSKMCQISNFGGYTLHF